MWLRSSSLLETGDRGRERRRLCEDASARPHRRGLIVRAIGFGLPENGSNLASTGCHVLYSCFRMGGQPRGRCGSRVPGRMAVPSAKWLIDVLFRMDWHTGMGGQTFRQEATSAILYCLSRWKMRDAAAVEEERIDSPSMKPLLRKYQTVGRPSADHPSPSRCHRWEPSIGHVRAHS